MPKHPPPRNYYTSPFIDADDWYPAFAWHPVNTEDRGWVWLRPVWRRRVMVKLSLPDGGTRWFQHVVKDG